MRQLIKILVAVLALSAMALAVSAQDLDIYPVGRAVIIDREYFISNTNRENFYIMGYINGNDVEEVVYLPPFRNICHNVPGVITSYSIYKKGYYVWSTRGRYLVYADGSIHTYGSFDPEPTITYEGVEFIRRGFNWRGCRYDVPRYLFSDLLRGLGHTAVEAILGTYDGFYYYGPMFHERYRGGRVTDDYVRRQERNSYYREENNSRSREVSPRSSSRRSDGGIRSSIHRSGAGRR